MGDEAVANAKSKTEAQAIKATKAEDAIVLANKVVAVKKAAKRQQSKAVHKAIRKTRTSERKRAAKLAEKARTEGTSAGYNSGHSQGYNEGNSQGYLDGLDDGATEYPSCSDDPSVTDLPYCEVMEKLMVGAALVATLVVASPASASAGAQLLPAKAPADRSIFCTPSHLMVEELAIFEKGEGNARPAGPGRPPRCPTPRCSGSRFAAERGKMGRAEVGSRIRLASRVTYGCVRARHTGSSGGWRRTLSTATSTGSRRRAPAARLCAGRLTTSACSGITEALG